MPASAAFLSVLLNVRDIERSIAFYSLLGFTLIDADRNGERIVWARMHCERGAIMFLAGDDDDTTNRAQMYLYTEDLPALRDQLIAAGVDAGEITRPPYMQSGELCVRDPDGHVVFIGHWSSAEHEAWEKQREEKRAAGLIP